jgi:hypothetical protein
MLTNAQMKPNRYARWAKARKKYNAIISNVTAGRTVVIANHMRAYEVTSKNVSLITHNKTGVYLKGQCIDFCSITVFG